eukprot:TRINITY_DN26448_c0_g1_i1.p1 TRINITY_DN26448_c0_g1~~TRINITY_DN26448_c0_g1_i1.p1  ORF type:complete len:313 (-),score=42.55 TRINITY_DN26448_c0_g1_i1:47-985(-)
MEAKGEQGKVVKASPVKRRFNPSNAVMTANNLLELPEELQYQIFVFLNEYDLSQLRVTSKQCLAISDSDMYWKLLYFSKIGPCPSSPMTKELGGWKKLFMLAYSTSCFSEDLKTYNVILSTDRRKARLSKTSLGVWGHVQGNTVMSGEGFWNYEIKVCSTGRWTVGVAKGTYFQGKHMNYNQGTLIRHGYPQKADTFQIGYNGSWGYSSLGHLMRCNTNPGDGPEVIMREKLEFKVGDILSLQVRRRAQGTLVRFSKKGNRPIISLEIPIGCAFLADNRVPLLLTATLFDPDSSISIVSLQCATGSSETLTL